MCVLHGVIFCICVSTLAYLGPVTSIYTVRDTE